MDVDNAMLSSWIENYNIQQGSIIFNLYLINQ